MPNFFKRQAICNQLNVALIEGPAVRIRVAKTKEQLRRFYDFQRNNNSPGRYLLLKLLLYMLTNIGNSNLSSHKTIYI